MTFWSVLPIATGILLVAASSENKNIRSFIEGIRTRKKDLKVNWEKLEQAERDLKRKP